MPLFDVQVLLFDYVAAKRREIFRVAADTKEEAKQQADMFYFAWGHVMPYCNAYAIGRATLVQQND